MTKIRCDQCEALMINGVFCHELGCPNSRRVWEDGEWVRYYECRECGYKLREYEQCTCQDIDEEDYEETNDAE